jgi:hypothetical protein
VVTVSMSAKPPDREVVRLNPSGRIIGSIIHIKFVEATLYCLRN